MILVVGACGAGKRAYAESLGYGEEEIADGVLDGRPVLNHLERLVFADPEGSAALLPALLEKELVLCDEVGSGIIPAHRAEREAREATGRLCIRLAAQAQKVVRLVCGIPQTIKGS